MPEGIEVFQDLNIKGPMNKKRDLQEALKSRANGRWSYSESRSHEIANFSTQKSDVLHFIREEDNSLPSAGLTLWEKSWGYHVSNIVPIKTSELSKLQYNGILNEFNQAVAEPAATETGFMVEVTKAVESLEDWLCPETAKKLRLFSGAANKSTGSSHPLDQRRWFDFLVSVHLNNDKIGVDQLMRWLNEVDSWSESKSHELALEFEFGNALLSHYEPHRRR